MSRTWLLLVAWFMLADCRPAWAMRLLEVQVVQRGEVRFKTSFEVPDRFDHADIWGRLGSVSLEPVGGSDAPGGETLTADVRVVVNWGGRPVVGAAVEQLRLVRDGARWRLPPAEVERTGLAAGFDLRARRRNRLLAVAIPAALFVVACGAVVWWALRRWGQPRA